MGLDRNAREGISQNCYRIKDTIAGAPVLKYYNTEEGLTLQCGASETELGAALIQGGKPVTFASKALT